VLARGERRAAGGIACADHDDIRFSKICGAHLLPFRFGVQESR
jgi:hypothetical protein